MTIFLEICNKLILQNYLKSTETFNNRKKKNIVKYILFQIFERIATERKR